MVFGKSELLFAGNAGRVDITPELPVELAGYSGPRRVSRNARGRLEANAVLIQAGSSRLLLVSLDLLYVGKDLAEAVCDRAAAHGIPAECVVVLASHTHFAPATDRTKPTLGPVDSDVLGAMVGRVVGLVDAVLAGPLQALRLEHTSCECALNVNRRKRRGLVSFSRSGLHLGPRVIMAPAPQAPRDTSLDMLRLVAPSGEAVVVLWKFACHPVGYPDRDAVTPEYPGFIRSGLRELTGSPGLPVLFLQGFAGDVRPWVKDSARDLHWLTALLRGTGVGSFTMDQWHAWCTEILAALQRGWHQPAWRLVAPSLSVASIGVPLVELLSLDEPRLAGNRSLTIQQIWLGDCLELLCLSAEPCTPWLRLGTRGRHTMHVGCAGGDVFGYLPSDAQADEGGYEGRDFLRTFGLAGSMRPGLEARVASAMDALAGQHGLGGAVACSGPEAAAIRLADAGPARA